MKEGNLWQLVAMPSRRAAMKKRQYSLFVKTGKFWERVSEFSYPRAVAIKVYSDALLSFASSGRQAAIRPLKYAGFGVWE